VRWGWTAAGALRIPGFDSEYWQRRATREFYLRPFFVWDTCVFVLRNPYFLRHLLNLGVELVPMYKLRSLFGRARNDEERAQVTARCPSAPNWDYAQRKDAEAVVAGETRRLEFLPMVAPQPPAAPAQTTERTH
jgi:hypothetical protein